MIPQQAIVDVFHWVMQLSSAEFLLILGAMALTGFAAGAALGKLRNVLLGR